MRYDLSLLAVALVTTGLKHILDCINKPHYITGGVIVLVIGLLLAVLPFSKLKGTNYKKQASFNNHYRKGDNTRSF